MVSNKNIGKKQLSLLYLCVAPFVLVI